MKKFAPIVAILAIVSLLPGCGGGSSVRFSDLFDESAAAEGTGVQFTGVVRAVVILATHDASARQRQVAEQNGKRAVAKLQARLKAQGNEAPAAKPHRTKTIASSASAKRQKKAEAAGNAGAEAKPKPVTSSKPKPLPRIIAVATEKDERTDKKAARAVMLFDTHAETIIGNKVYDIDREPRAGEDVRFETYSTSYIGASL